MPSTNRFRISSKNIFLTYPHCSLTKESALEQIQAITCSSNKKYIKICRKLHENGEPRLHVLIQFEGKSIITNSSLFDLKSPTRSAYFHPNIQGAKSSSDVKSYLDKDGDTIDWGEFQVDGRSARGGQHSIKDAYAKALNTGSMQEALTVIRELCPRHFVLQFHNMRRKLDSHFNRPLPPTSYSPYFQMGSFQKVPYQLWAWAFNSLGLGPLPGINGPPKDKPKSIIIEGGTRIGKTCWARMLGPHNYLAGSLDLNGYSNEAQYNVIDNIDPQYLKHWKELIGAQRDWYSKPKYSKPILVKGGIPSIVLCNPGKGSSYWDYLQKSKNTALCLWTSKNADFVFLNSSLFE